MEKENTTTTKYWCGATMYNKEGRRLYEFVCNDATEWCRALEYAEEEGMMCKDFHLL